MHANVFWQFSMFYRFEERFLHFYLCIFFTDFKLCDLECYMKKFFLTRVQVKSIFNALESVSIWEIFHVEWAS